VAAVAGLTVLAAAFSSDDDNDNYSDDGYIDFDNNSDVDEIALSNPRYKVEFKALKTGEWYTKTETNHIGGAYSSARCNNLGRAYRITDTDTGDILEEEGAKR
jgi:hypothetical protein